MSCLTPGSQPFWILLFFACLAPTLVGAAPIQITTARNNVEIQPADTAWMVDPSGRTELNELRILTKNFTPPKKLSFGYSKDVHWLRFELENMREEREFLLEISYPVLDRIDLFVLNRNGTTTQDTQGDDFPFAKRSLSHRNFVFRVPLGPKEGAEVYLRVHTTSAVSVPMRLYTREAFGQKDHTETAVLMLFYGAVTMMMLYNFSLFIYLRNTSYLYYSLYIMSITLVFAVQNGVAYEYLWPDLVWWNNRSQALSVNLAAIWSVVFCRSFLRTTETFPAMSRLLQYAAIGGAACALSSLFVPITLALRLASLQVVLAAVLAITTGTILLFRGFVLARFYLLAWTVLLLGVVIASLRNFGFVPHNVFTTYGMQFGSALEILLLSFGLGYRINLLRAENEREKREITESVARFVPTEFLKYLGATDIRQIEYGRAVAENFTVMFIDIRNFTWLSEKMSVEDNFRFLNSYLKRMVPHIHHHDGIIDKFIGDAILALFAGKPTAAVRAAIDMRRSLIDYNEYRVKTQGFQPIQTGTGLHTGRLMLGTVGFDKKSLSQTLKVPGIEKDRLDTTVIGDTVNVASRLQDLTKKYGGTVLLSEAVYADLPDSMLAHTREIGQIRVRGKETDIRVYENFEGDPEPLRLQKLESLIGYTRAREIFKAKEYGEALSLFNKLKSDFPDDPLMDYYCGRCRQMIEMAGL